MSERQLMMQVQPDVTRVILETVEKYIQEKVDGKLKILTQQVVSIHDELRALRQSMVSEFIDSLVSSLTEQRFRSILGEAIGEFGKDLAGAIQKLALAIEALGTEQRKLAEALEGLNSRVDRMERALEETQLSQKVQIDVTPTERELEEVRKQIKELEERVGAVTSTVSELERTVRRTIEGFSVLSEEMEKTMSALTGAGAGETEGEAI